MADYKQILGHNKNYGSGIREKIHLDMKDWIRTKMIRQKMEKYIRTIRKYIRICWEDGRRYLPKERRKRVNQTSNGGQFWNV